MKVIADIRGESVRYDAELALRDVTLQIQRGEKVALVGRSGAGKSTLLRLLYERVQVESAMVPQDFGLVRALSVFHNVYIAHLRKHTAFYNFLNLVKPLRKEVEKGAALVPSSKKMGSPGQVLDIPLGHKDAAYVRSHFDGMEVRVNDAPRAGEILVAVAVTDSGRPLPRVGGLTTDDMIGEDGLR